MDHGGKPPELGTLGSSKGAVMIQVSPAVLLSDIKVQGRGDTALRRGDGRELVNRAPTSCSRSPILARL